MSVQTFIQDQLPVALLARLPSLLIRGDELAKQIVKDNPVLRIPSLQRGDIRGAAIDFTVSEFLYSRANQFTGLTSRFASYSKPTGKYFLMESAESVMTISHLTCPAAVPRPAGFRIHGCANNHPELFAEDELKRLAKEAERIALEEADRKRHLVLIYGNQRMEFVQIGALDPTAGRWLETPMDLLAGPMVLVDHEDDDTQATDISIPMDVKEQFIQHLSENAE